MDAINMNDFSVRDVIVGEIESISGVSVSGWSAIYRVSACRF